MIYTHKDQAQKIVEHHRKTKSIDIIKNKLKGFKISWVKYSSGW